MIASRTEINPDKARLDWLDAGGRIAHIPEGWNAWTPGPLQFARSGSIRPTVREAIDAEMEVAKEVTP